MRFATASLCYQEERLIGPHLRHIPDWVETKLVLISKTPWQGEPELPDKTEEIAKSLDADVMVYDWKTEEEQRNAAQEYLFDVDWILVLDPDEYMVKSDWERLRTFLETAEGDAYVCREQVTYYKDGKIEPAEDYKQIVAVRPTVRFVDKRVVDCSWGYAPITLHHLSWRRTDAEILKKISHYSHAHELLPNWYQEVWLADKRENVHPLTPESLKRVVPADLPSELKELGL